MRPEVSMGLPARPLSLVIVGLAVGAWLAGSGCATPAAPAKVLRLASDDWSSRTLAGDHRLASLWIDPAGLVWAAGHGAVVRWDGASPPEVTEVKGPLTALWGSSASDVWAVGSDGGRVHFDGKAWARAADGGAAAGPLFAAWGSGPGDVWAAGEAVLRWDGRKWAAQPSPSALWIRGIWGSGPDDVWLVASSAPFAEVAGEILHWDGKALRSALKTPEPLQAVWGSSPQDVWVVGASPSRDDAAARSVVRHFDGAAWREATSFGGVELVAVWGSGPRDVWCAGPAGQVMRFDGAAWTPVALGSRLDVAAGARHQASVYLLAPSGELLSRDAAAPGRP